MKKLAIITTHPIQYNAPFFRLLSQSKIVAPMVFYTWGNEGIAGKFDQGFGKNISWDIPLLEGYDYIFIENSAKVKGSHHFNGIRNPHLIKQLENWNPDAILVYGWNFKSHLSVIRHFSGQVPVWFRGDSTLLDKVPILKGFTRKSLLSWVYSHIDHAFFTGTANKAYFLKFGMNLRNMSYAPHAIDNKRFSESRFEFSLAANDIRRSLNLNGDHLVFLYAGKLIPKKGVETLIRAFSNINDPEIHLVIAGNGPLEKVLKENFGRFVRVHFMDFQNQSVMPALYRMADAFVLPSVGPGETWGLAVNEAMACQKPVLVSDKCGCAPDLVEEGRTGYTFSAGNVKELQHKLQLVVNRRDELKSMGQFALEKVLEFDFRDYVIAIENQFSN